MSVGLVATAIGLLVNTVEILRLGKGLRDYVARRSKGSKERIDIPEDQEEGMRALIGGEIGSKLMSAFISYVELGDPKPLTEAIDQIEERRSVDVVVDVIGRNPEIMYKSQFKRDPDYLYKYRAGSLGIRDFPVVSASVAKFLELINNLHPLAKKRVVLAAPVVLGFQVGQLVGSTAKFYPLHMVRDSGYEEVEPVIRF